MGILKTAVFGLVGFLAYRTWQKKKAETSFPTTSTSGSTAAGGSTPPHGDPLLAELDPDVDSPRMAQSSRGFGEA